MLLLLGIKLKKTLVPVSVVPPVHQVHFDIACDLKNYFDSGFPIFSLTYCEEKYEDNA